METYAAWGDLLPGHIGRATLEWGRGLTEDTDRSHQSAWKHKHNNAMPPEPAWRVVECGEGR